MTIKAERVKSGCEFKDNDCRVKLFSRTPDKHNEMKRLELTTDLLTGIVEIDNQHRELFNMGNSALFPDAVEPSTRAFADALVFLVRYVDYHFSAEEDAMKSHRYNRFKSHKKQHDRFRKDIKAVLKLAKKKGPTKHLKLKFHYMFSDWFSYHIKHVDLVLAEYLRAPNSRLAASLGGHDELQKISTPIESSIRDTENASGEFGH